MVQSCVDWNNRIISHKLNSLGDLLHYQDHLVTTLKIPKKFSERKPYQNKMYKVIRNRERKLFNEVCRISHSWYGHSAPQGTELSQMPCQKAKLARSYLSSALMCRSDL